MQLVIQPSFRQRQRAMVSNGIAGANNTVDATLVTITRNAENASKIFKQETGITFFIFRGTKYTTPIAGY